MPWRGNILKIMRKTNDKDGHIIMKGERIGKVKKKSWRKWKCHVSVNELYVHKNTRSSIPDVPKIFSVMLYVRYSQLIPFCFYRWYTIRNEVLMFHILWLLKFYRCLCHIFNPMVPNNFYFIPDIIFLRFSNASNI